MVNDSEKKTSDENRIEEGDTLNEIIQKTKKQQEEEAKSIVEKVLRKLDKNQPNELNVEERPRRELHNLARGFSSPYMVQYRDLFKDMNRMHVAISDYAFADGDPTEVLYYDGFYSINRKEMQTLIADEEVMNCVVDVWCSILNDRMKHATHGPRDKIFLSLDPFMVMCTDEICAQDITKEERIEVFLRKLKDELKNNNIQHIKNLEMIFIPALSSYHYYLMCVHFKKATIFVIDNRKLPQNVKFKNKYGDEPLMMLTAVAEFLKTQKISCTEALLDYKQKLVRMKWRSSKDDKNCGIYLMHHIETFNGEEDWETDFSKKDPKEALLALRVRYCSQIIIHEKNNNKNKILADARRRRLDSSKDLKD